MNCIKSYLLSKYSSNSFCVEFETMTKSITIRISEEDKDRWKEYVDKRAEFESVTNLIKSCVEREIARTDDSPDEKNPLRLLSDVMEEVEKNRSEIQTVLDNTEKIQSRQAEKQDFGKLYRQIRKFTENESKEDN